MRKLVFIFCLLIGILPLLGQPKLSDNAQISVLTSAPYDEEVFTVYGHAAFRVNDPAQDIDLVFNYGIFDFSKPNFMYRFAKGETDYKLGVADFLNYAIEYQMRGSDITEQVLNLTTDEKNKLWDALLLNYRPENRTYRYNFFFDNCATRLPALVEKHINGTIVYNNPPEAKSFRDLINYCTRNHPWLTFGCDLVVGNPADKTATPHQMMFLPKYVQKEFADATVIDPNGEERSLVAETSVIEAVSVGNKSQSVWNILTPLVCCWLLLAVIGLITYIEWKRKSYYLAVDFVLFTIAGIAGIVIFFLSFISEHPSMWPNWNILWLHPLHLIGVFLFCLKKLNKAAYYYHFINFALLTLMLIGWNFIPQHLNPAFIPLVATLWLRSGWGVVRKTRERIG